MSSIPECFSGLYDGTLYTLMYLYFLPLKPDKENQFSLFIICDDNIDKFGSVLQYLRQFSEIKYFIKASDDVDDYENDTQDKMCLMSLFNFHQQQCFTDYNNVP